MWDGEMSRFSQFIGKNIQPSSYNSQNHITTAVNFLHRAIIIIALRAFWNDFSLL